jgi:hypothetical protein
MTITAGVPLERCSEALEDLPGHHTFVVEVSRT